MEMTVEMARSVGDQIVASTMTRRWTFEMVPVGDLKTDPAYHDPARFNQKRADRLAAVFDTDRCGTITVSERRDGSRWIIDGQHRCAGARGAGVEFLPARVFRGLELAEEAAIFYGLSDFVRLRPEAQWRARIAMGEATAGSIAATMSVHGTRFATGGSAMADPRTTRAFGVVEALHKASILGPVLSTALVAWPEDPHALDAVTLAGIGSFLLTYSRHPHFQHERLITKLSEWPASAVIRRTKDLQAVGTSAGGKFGTGGTQSSSSTLLGKSAARNAVLSIYNRKLRVPIQEATLSDLKAIGRGDNPWG